MSTGLFRGGVTPATFRPDYDSFQDDVSIGDSVVVRVLEGDPNRVGIVMQSISITVLVVRFRGLTLSQPGIELNVAAQPVILTFGDLGPIIGDPLFCWSQGGPGRIFLLTASDRGTGRKL